MWLLIFIFSCYQSTAPKAYWKERLVASDRNPQYFEEVSVHQTSPISEICQVHLIPENEHKHISDRGRLGEERLLNIKYFLVVVYSFLHNFYILFLQDFLHFYKNGVFEDHVMKV